MHKVTIVMPNEIAIYNCPEYVPSQNILGKMKKCLC